jgi:amidophosphoribosyltransferase
VQPGEVVWVDDEGLHAAQGVPTGRRALCIFEHVYFARPDSRVGGVEVHGARVRMGERLAGEAPADADLVIGVADGGTPAAIGFSKASGIRTTRRSSRTGTSRERSSSPSRACASRASG